MPKRKRKKYSRPQKPFDKARIQEENLLRDKYGLKNKKEIWKADAAISRIRNLAKQLITKSEEEKKAFIEKLKAKGFNVNNIADSLSLNKEDWLKRRLQTIVFTKKFARTPRQSRQLIAHKQVSIGNRTINIPSYQVSLEQEPNIKLNIVLKRPKNSKKENKEKIGEIKVKEVKPVEEVVEETKEKLDEILKEGKTVEETKTEEKIEAQIPESPSEQPITDTNKIVEEK